VVRVWMVYLFVVVVGIGQVVDLTSRRALIHDVVGQRLIGTAMALEALSLSTGNTIGALSGGAVIGLLGIGQGFGTMGLLWATSFVLLLQVRRPDLAPVAGPRAGIAEIRRDLVTGARSLPGNPHLVSLLGITAIMNLLFFAYFPLVPVLAERFDVGPFLTGLLASGHGIGMLVGASTLVAINPANRGRVYTVGSFGAMGFLAVFVNMPAYPLALAAMIVMGSFAAGFAATQSALVLHVASDEMRGRAMGMLSMCIGALPFGMAAVGGLAQAIGASRALTLSSMAGLVMLGLWTWRHPEILKVG
jgi:predicted MFS family arabinose efflux permease